LHRVKYYSARIPQGSLRYPISFLDQLPIRVDNKIEEQLNSLVQKILDSSIKKEQSKMSPEYEQLRDQIDALVFKLYGMTETETLIILNSEKIDEINQRSILNFM
jgi:hypothetical protein